MNKVEAKQGKKRTRFKRLLDTIINKDDWQHFRKPVISAFLLLHCSLNLAYMFNIHPYQGYFTRLFWAYYHFMGLDQDFGVFAPLPRNINLHMTALVTYADGSSKIWMNPRMERIDYLPRIEQERYRKFFDDNLAWPLYKVLWPDIAASIARRNYDNPANPPKTVAMMRFESMVLPPEEGIKYKHNQPHFQQHMLQTYIVKPEDLR